MKYTVIADFLVKQANAMNTEISEGLNTYKQKAEELKQKAEQYKAQMRGIKSQVANIVKNEKVKPTVKTDYGLAEVALEHKRLFNKYKKTLNQSKTILDSINGISEKITPESNASVQDKLNKFRKSKLFNIVKQVV